MKITTWKKWVVNIRHNSVKCETRSCLRGLFFDPLKFFLNICLCLLFVRQWRNCHKPHNNIYSSQDRDQTMVL
jgi:hypothetical protein